jgi:hypothetical protein
VGNSGSVGVGLRTGDTVGTAVGETDGDWRGAAPVFAHPAAKTTSATMGMRWQREPDMALSG